jgi:hypothetical protein
LGEDFVGVVLIPDVSVAIQQKGLIFTAALKGHGTMHRFISREHATRHTGTAANKKVQGDKKMKDRSHITLYSGGHKGTEAEFGRLAKRWGIQEVNFSFEGHAVERTRGVRVLSPEELLKGDVSLEIVSTRMGRNYSNVDKIRKVIQSIFHMVNNGYHVIAVGWIQADDTVKGGTGWGVELAKLFNRPLSVYDQERKGWFAWTDNRWVAETPKMTDSTFVGTGTRNLTDDGLKAIYTLFENSFGSEVTI